MAIAVAGCAGSGVQPKIEPTRATNSATASPAATSHIAKVIVFILENHSLDQMKKGLPYTFGVAKQYGYASHYSAITHPSLPNYLAITGGSLSKVHDDNSPSKHELKGQSVFGQAIAAGKTAGVYADAMKTNCEQKDDGTYIVHHNPWAYYASERAECQQFDVPLAQLTTDAAAGTLPNVGMVVPDVCHDAHSCPLSSADAWMKVWLPKVMSGPDWLSGQLAVVITADEGYKRLPGNSVLTSLAYLGEKSQIVRTKLTHYSLTRLYEDVAGVPRLGHAATARSLSKAFGFTIG